MNRLGLAALTLTLAACGGAGEAAFDAGKDVVDVTDADRSSDEEVAPDVTPDRERPMDTGCTTDEDGDGVVATSCGGSDCDDGDPRRYPGNAEVCDPMGHDEDCNPCTVASATTRDGDGDMDGFVGAGCFNTYGGATPTCDPMTARVSGAMLRVTGRDCDDTDGNVRPNQTESCNGRDDNCDGMVDEGVATTRWFRDVDRDGHGEARGAAVVSCANPSTPAAQYVTGADDCDDADPLTYAGAEERCDGRMRDENCNGPVDEGCACDEGRTRPCEASPGTRSLGVCGGGTQTCLRGSMAVRSQWGACSIQPGVEVCNGLDDDCDGMTDEPSTIPAGTTAPPNAIVAGRCGTLTGGVCTAGACRCMAGQESCGGTCRETGMPCSVGVGGCARSGRLLCAATGTACSSATGVPLAAGSPAAETCNAVDDDCDGATDEDLHSGAVLTLGGESRRLCDGDFCTAVAHQACATTAPAAPLCQGNTGIAFYPGGDNVDGICLALPTSGARAVPVHQRSSYEIIADGRTAICTSDVSERDGQACFQAAHTWCAARGYLTGFLARERTATGLRGEVYVTCLREEHVAMVTRPRTAFTPGTRCDFRLGRVPVTRPDGCGVQIRGFCLAAGYLGGWGPVLFTDTDVTFACLRRF